MLGDVAIKRSILLLALSLGLSAGADRASVKLEFITDLNIRPGTPFDQVGSATATQNAATLAGSVLTRKASGAFGGISALAYDEKSRTLYALSDSAKPILFTFEMTLSGKQLGLKPLRALPLRETDGTEIATWVLDPEGIVLTPRGTLLISSEGYAGRKPPVQPGIVEFTTDGRKLGELGVPADYLVPADGSKSGVRHNLGWEGLAISGDGSTVWAGTEGPLMQDGDICSFEKGCTSRILGYGWRDGRYVAGREYRYTLDSIHKLPGAVKPTGNTGLSELLWVGGRTLLALERSFAMDPATLQGSVRVRLYQVELGEASELKKTLVVDMDDIRAQLSAGYQTIDNLEGLALGPRLEDGSRTVMVVSDDNYAAIQRTQFLIFRIVEK
jgi:hypothetical protein